MVRMGRKRNELLKIELIMVLFINVKLGSFEMEARPIPSSPRYAVIECCHLAVVVSALNERKARPA